MDSIKKIFFKNHAEFIFGVSFLVACITLGITAFRANISDDSLASLLNVFAPAVLIAALSGIVCIIRIIKRRQDGHI